MVTPTGGIAISMLFVTENFLNASTAKGGDMAEKLATILPDVRSPPAGMQGRHQSAVDRYRSGEERLIRHFTDRTAKGFCWRPVMHTRRTTKQPM